MPSLLKGFDREVFLMGRKSDEDEVSPSLCENDTDVARLFVSTNFDLIFHVFEVDPAQEEQSQTRQSGDQRESTRRGPF